MNLGRGGSKKEKMLLWNKGRTGEKLSRDILENREQKERLASELRDIEEKFNLAEKEWNEVKGRLENHAKHF